MDWFVGKVGDALGNPSGPKVFSVGGQKWEEVKLLGEGGFGYVYIVENSTTRKQAALKQLNCSSEQFELAKKEVAVMKNLKGHPNIVQFFDAGTTSLPRGGTEVVILMELCQGSLVDLMKRKVSSQSKLAEKEIWEIFYDVCSGIEALHNREKPISHRDIKPENVLRSRDGRWKLCDFGSCTNIVYDCSNDRDRLKAEDDIQKNTTLPYRAPEMVDLQRRQIIAERVDIWALGTLLYTLLFFEAPFNDSSLGILNCSYYWPEKFSYSARASEMVKKLLRPDPEDRPDILTLLGWVERILERNVLEREKKTPDRYAASKTVTAEAPKPKPPVQAQNLFSMLDWQDDKGNATSSPTVQPNQSGFGGTKPPSQPPQTNNSFFPTQNQNQNQSAPSFANFANFANFPSQPNPPGPPQPPAPATSSPAQTQWDPFSSGSSSGFNSTPVYSSRPETSGFGNFSLQSSQASPQPSLSDSLGSIRLSATAPSESEAKEKLEKLFDELGQNAKNPEQILRILIDIHQLLQSSIYPSVFGLAYKRKTVIEKLNLSNSLDFMAPTDGPTKTINRKYSQAILLKISFHQTYPQFEGSFSLGTYAQAEKKPEKDLLNGIMQSSLIDSLLELQKAFCLPTQDLFSGSLTGSKLVSVVPIFKELYNVYLLLSYSLINFKDHPKLKMRLNDHKKAYSQQFSSFFGFYQEIQKKKTQFTYSFPEIPNNATLHSGLKIALPSSLSQTF